MPTQEESCRPLAWPTNVKLAAAVLLTLSGAIPGVATAALPDPGHCVVPHLINIVGKTAGAPDPTGAFSVIVHDATDAPISGITVSVDFSGAPDVSLSNTQLAATLVSCAPPVVSAVTDNNGVAQFTVLGGVTNVSGTWSLTSTAAITAGSTAIGTSLVRAFDLDGSDGSTPNDIHLMFGPFGAGPPYPAIMDYSGDGQLSAVDFSLMASDVTSNQALDQVAWCGTGPGSSITTTITGITLIAQDCVTGLSSPQCSGNFGHTDFQVAVTLPSALNEVTGVEATIELSSGSSPFPAYYRFDAAGCHHNGLSGVAPSGLGDCLDTSPMFIDPYNLDPFQASPVAVAYYPEPVTGSTNVEVIQALEVLHPAPYVGCIPSSSGGATCCWDYPTIPASTQTTVCAFRVSHSGFTCTGCGPITMIVESLRLTTVQPADWAYHAPPPTCPIPQDLVAHVHPDVVGGTGPRASAALVPSELVVYPDKSGTNILQLDGGAADVPSSSSEAWLARASPNPSQGEVSLSFTLPRTGHARIAIVDVAGRLVRTLEDGELSAGPHQISWDGHNETGALVHAGVYFCRLMTEQRALTSTIVFRN